MFQWLQLDVEILIVENAEPFMRGSGTKLSPESTFLLCSLLHLIFANQHFDYFYYCKSTE